MDNSTKLNHSERMKICRGCEFFRDSIAQCKKCGCFMPVKTRLEIAKCPVGKW